MPGARCHAGLLREHAAGVALRSPSRAPRPPGGGRRTAGLSLSIRALSCHRYGVRPVAALKRAAKPGRRHADEAISSSPTADDTSSRKHPMTRRSCHGARRTALSPETADSLSAFRGDYFSLMAPVGPYNDMDLHPHVEFTLREGWTVGGGSLWFWRTRLDDGVYGVAGQWLRSGAGTTARFGEGHHGPPLAGRDARLVLCGTLRTRAAPPGTSAFPP